MSNSLVANPWVLDTAGTTTLWSDFVKIRHIEFVSYLGAAHTCVLTDNYGRTIWEGHGNTDLAPVVSQEVGWVHGLKLTTIDSGKVLVFIQ
jgi:hypothetical protein